METSMLWGNGHRNRNNVGMITFLLIFGSYEMRVKFQATISNKLEQSVKTLEEKPEAEIEEITSRDTKFSRSNWEED